MLVIEEDQKTLFDFIKNRKPCDTFKALVADGVIHEQSTLRELAEKVKVREHRSNYYYDDMYIDLMDDFQWLISHLIEHGKVYCVYFDLYDEKLTMEYDDDGDLETVNIDYDVFIEMLCEYNKCSPILDGYDLEYFT